METIYIVNITEKSFFKYIQNDTNDIKYKKKLLELLTPPKIYSSMFDTFIRSEYSHWNRSDHIVIAPENLHEYLEKTYNELHI